MWLLPVRAVAWAGEIYKILRGLGWKKAALILPIMGAIYFLAKELNL